MDNFIGNSRPTVFVVDDDESMREALRSLFRSVKLKVETFGSTADFLRSKLADVASCLVLDVRLPGISGLDFQAELAKAVRDPAQAFAGGMRIAWMRIGRAHDFAQQHQRSIRKLIFFQDRIE